MKLTSKTLFKIAAVLTVFLLIGIFISGTVLSQGQGLKVRVGVYDNPPKEFAESTGGYAGIFPDILEVIAQDKGWQLEYVFGNWTTCLDRLESGEVDVLVDVGYSAERAAIYDFGKETVLNNWGVIYRNPSSAIESLTDLEGKKVAVMIGSVHTEGDMGIKALTKSFSINCTFVEVASYEDVFQLIDSGAVDAGVVNRIFGEMSQDKFNVKRTNIIFDPSELRFAFPKSAALNAVLIPGIDSDLHAMKENGHSEYYTILDNYLGKLPKQRVTPSWVLPAIGIALGVIVFLAIVSLLFRWQVNRRVRELKSALEKREDLERIIDESPAVVFRWRSEEGWPVDVVSENIAMFGYKPEEFKSGDVKYAEIIHPDDFGRIAAEVERYSKDGRDEFVQTYRILTKSGSIRWVEDHTFTRKDKSGRITHYQGIMSDITERKRAEEERRKLELRAHIQDRLASVGEMAAGIAHEINNPLTSVVGFSQLLQQRDVPQDIKKDLENIDEGAQRVASILKRLLAFARQQKPERSYVNINEIITTTLALQAYSMETSNMKVTTYLDPALPWTMADGGQMQEVFLNIIINAEREMRLAHGKGNLQIKTEKRDNTIGISFVDDGPGIPEENLEKIFEAFYTTRKDQGGTGLGLSICYGIMAEHNGRIYARSQLGQGATFIVELPIVAQPAQPEPAEPVAEMAATAVKAKILVVDDEHLILELLSRVLIGEGYEVVTVDNASDALERIKSERFSLILLDIRLRGTSGIDVYEDIREMNRSLAERVVFITGDVMGTDTRDFLSRTKAHYFAKPFDIKQVRQEIKRILTQGS